MSKDIIYVANARVPSRKAHPYQIVQMCHGFVENDQNVELVIPYRRQPPDLRDVTIEEYFDTPIDFTVTRLPCLDLLLLIPYLPAPFPRLISYLQTFTFTLAALGYMRYQRTSEMLVYSRALLFTCLGSLLFGDTMIVELHRVPSRQWVRWLLGRVFNHLCGVVTISDALREDWLKFTDAPILVAADGVRLKRFDINGDRETHRARLDLPTEGHLVTYVGSLKQWKGVDSLVRAAGYLSGEIEVCIVGGYGDQQTALRNRVTIPSNTHLIGHVCPEKIPYYLAGSDVLVIPNTREEEISARHTSPLKLFEYMAAERPIVASDLPSLREILDEDAAYFFEAGNAKSLAASIERAIADPGATERAAEARDRVERYSWEMRGEKVISFFETN